jgi:hypothetical protein
MNNTVITSISALVFLVIGLFIGKSNKQIEIQTVVKTNIVEKPVVEYVPKFITNVFETVVESEIPIQYKNSLRIVKQIFNSEWLSQTNGRKLPHFESLSVTAIVSEELKDIISSEDVKNKLELELRKAGVKIDQNPTGYLTATLQGFELDKQSQYAYHCQIDLETLVFLYDFKNEIAHRNISSIWNDSYMGVVGKNIINKTFINNKFVEMSDRLINKLLEAKEKRKSNEQK